MSNDWQQNPQYSSADRGNKDRIEKDRTDKDRVDMDQVDMDPSRGPASASPAPTGDRVPRTRTGATWFGLCIAALLFVVLIIFMLQNLRDVQISFLWLDGSAPLALALLIAAVGAAIVTMAVGAARIAQLRRLTRRHRP